MTGTKQGYRSVVPQTPSPTCIYIRIYICDPLSQMGYKVAVMITRWLEKTSLWVILSKFNYRFWRFHMCMASILPYPHLLLTFHFDRYMNLKHISNRNKSTLTNSSVNPFSSIFSRWPLYYYHLTLRGHNFTLAFVMHSCETYVNSKLLGRTVCWYG